MERAAQAEIPDANTSMKITAGFAHEFCISQARNSPLDGRKELPLKGGLVKDYVNTVLRKDGTVVTITPTDGAYDLAVEDRHRTVRPDVAADPLNDPEFDAIVRELKRELEPRSRTRVRHTSNGSQPGC